jgi:hypothetical protein
MNRREFLVTSATVLGTTRVAKAALAFDNKRSVTSEAQPQPASFGAAGRDFPKVGGNLANKNYSTLE